MIIFTHKMDFVNIQKKGCDAATFLDLSDNVGISDPIDGYSLGTLLVCYWYTVAIMGSMLVFRSEQSESKKVKQTPCAKKTRATECTIQN